MNKHIATQIANTYKRMATRARYRPAAPGDGMGNILFPEQELDLEQEQFDYIKSWWATEDSGTYPAGVPDFTYRPALIFIIEAARNLNGMAPEVARKLLVMAIEQIDHENPVDVDQLEKDNAA